MRLRQIRLAGFKSFADPALIQLERPVVGIVGPNGCGKSNIIDAVRWVLGEARVSELRGSSSMKELIFAGSTSRRPLGRASVELILVNDDGRIKGPWADYAEISVKRVVTSIGQSAYYINGQQVRRRDVQEIFLGTGLGPRSYAIISQGMISSFIKAKPEELRVYLEEAAGVSLYRERRKETESLLGQTRANLERVRDMQSVKAEEAARLEGEAELACRWKALTAERNEAEALWYWIQFDEVRRTVEQLDADIARSEAEIEERKAAVLKGAERTSALEAALEEAEKAVQAEALALRAAERQLTEAESEARRLADLRTRAEADLAQAEANAAAKRADLAAVRQSAEGNLDEIAALEKEREETAEQAAAAEEEVFRAEDRRDAEKRLADEARAAAAALEGRFRTAAAGADAALRRAADLKKRLERVTASRAAAEEPDPALLEAAEALREEASAAAEEARALYEEAGEALCAAEKTQRSADEAYFSSLSAQKAAAAKLDALEAVQADAEGSGQLAEFEKNEGLDGLDRLADAVTADPRWVNAAEAFLGRRASARRLRMLESASGYALRRPPAPIVFVDAGAKAPEQAAALEIEGREFAPLSSFVTSDDPALSRALSDWLGRAYCIADVPSALRLRGRLPVGCCFVTPEGDTVSAAGLEFWAAVDPSFSILSRRQEIERVRAALFGLEDELGVRDAERSAARSAFADAQAREKRRAAEVRTAEAHAQKAAAQCALEAEKQAAARQRLSDMERDRKELEEDCLAAQAEADEAQDRADEAEKASQGAARRASAAQSALTRAEEALHIRRDAFTALSHRSELARVKAGQLRASAVLFEERRRSLEKDIAAEEARREDARHRLEEAGRLRADDRTAEALRRYGEAEEKHLEAGRRRDAARESLASARRELTVMQSEVVPLSEALGVKKVERQMKESLREQFSGRLDELGADRDALREKAAARPQKAQSVRARVLKLISEIAALGPVNHAALEHLEAVRRVLEATARQVEDLEKGIATLEAAIRKIDAETRERMKDTFEEVNAHFAETFSELFGGGIAELTVTSDDILTAGLEVRAQPPGKHNAGVKLLSGGEQALAATALVFAIFKLNPAPFCLLDEVDAPLDEANQARLAGLCRRMSESTQFLMITHHRVTMEFAGALVGVTMKEPGVSRVVSVDIENAVRMAG
ncbi:MAG: chromosome segregation protein SMC [Sutterella sp.]|nr:chromosome segregation protein SMC [Sutterella sp.]